MRELREERSGDAGDIDAVLGAAFDGDEERRLVADLRAGGWLSISLVSEVDGRVVGHVALSPVHLPTATGDAPGLGLAPLAVLPEHQGSGLGTDLVVSGLQAARALGARWIVVLGDPRYYARFGFERADRFGLRCRWNVPPEHYMALELEPGALSSLSGEVRYAPAFDAL